MQLDDDFIFMKHDPMYQNRDSDWELIMIHFARLSLAFGGEAV